MTKNIIPLAGIFLACVIATIIPAAAAAEPVNPVTAPAAEPTPWYIPLGEWIGIHDQSASHPVNATPEKTEKNTSWGENVWPFQDTSGKAEQTPSVQPAEQPAVPDTPAHDAKDTSAALKITDKSQDAKKP